MPSRKVWWNGAWVTLDGASTPEVLIGNLTHAGNSVGFGPNISYAVLAHTVADITINRIGCKVSAQAGNIDLGVYDNDGSGGNPGTLLVSTGSIACPAVGWREEVVADTIIPAGLFWIAIGISSTSAGFAYGNRVSFIDPGTQVIVATADTTRSQSAFPLPSPGAFGAGSTFHQNLWVRYV